MSLSPPLTRSEPAAVLAAVKDAARHLCSVVVGILPTACEPRRLQGESGMARMDGKVALITGAGTGIGRATARAMAANGAKVVVAELNAAAGDQTAQIISQAGGQCIAVPTDVSQEDSVRAAIETAVRHYGGLHILHNNAGGSTPADNTVVDAPIDEFWRAIRLDLFGTFLGCRFGIPVIIASGGGSVINMASNVALMGVAGLDCYTAAKVFLVSDESRMVTGQVYPVDSGITIS
jgi:NADP-dependent 3-hydroxy acid dehydrogenase YdfG